MTFPPATPTPSFPYRIDRPVGEGAMGIVYRAFEPQLERPVAIKVLKTETLGGDAATADESRRRFLQEARAAAALSHPGVATIYRIGEESGRPWLALEWLDGETLEAKVRATGPLPPDEVARLGVELLLALDAAHRAGIVHRDVKPANLMLLKDGRLKVTDFGIARLRGSDLVQTQAGYLLATPRYASPEQLRGEPIDARSDLFSAAVVLYHLVSATYPFRGEDFLQIASAVLTASPRPLRTVAPHVPFALAAAIERGLERDPAHRFASAAEMAAALEGTTTRATTAAGLTARISSARPAPAAAPLTGGALFRDLPTGPADAVRAAASSWPSRDLGTQDRQALLDRLLDRPLHAPPFAGALAFGASLLLIADGLLLGAIGDGTTCDAVVEGLPERAPAALHPAPEELAGAAVRALAGLLRPVRVRHDGLDSSFVNLAALGDKLAAEGFDGALHLARGSATATVLFAGGSPLLRLFTSGWDGLPIDAPWTDLVAAVPVRAAVWELAPTPCLHSFRRELRDLTIAVRPRPTAPRPAGRTDRLRFDLAPSRDVSGPLVLGDDPAYRFLAWCLDELPAYLRERDRTARWKYLVDWVSDVRQARLHADLERPDRSGTDSFDLATEDGDGKILHLARRVARATPEALAAFKSDVVAAKSARIKTGDVGGAFLIAPEFDDTTLAALVEIPVAERSGKWFGVEESFTGYEGFVRIGPRRGFHLLPIRETESGFEPILP